MTGIELIAKERQEQFEKHGRTVDRDVLENGNYQLTIGAHKLLTSPGRKNSNYQSPPLGWDLEIWEKMRTKPYKERLIIAGALIAAELDRLNA